MIDLNACSKIGILGGTFNPIHMGHLFLAEHVAEAEQLDVVVLMPSGVSYMKRDTGVLPGEIRLEMVNLCVKENPRLVSSDMEIKRKGNTYTYETILRFKQDYPDANIYFIVGADSLLSMEQWVNPEIIFENCIVLAVGRNQMTSQELMQKKFLLENRYGGTIRLLELPLLDISSTMIREKVKHHKSIRYMVTEDVRKYILEKGLYES